VTDFPVNGDDDQAYIFGPFRLLRVRRRLFRGDEPVVLGSRAIDILLLLVERSGELVSKAEIIAAVWPDTFVEEANLRVQIAGIRRALGDESAEPVYLQTVAGRGYRFIGSLSGAPPLPVSTRSAEVPTQGAKLFGRAEDIEALSGDILRWRLVSIVGLGGVGKTRVALAVAEQVRPHFRDGVYYLDFLSISDQLLVPSALASALGAAVQLDDPIPILVSKLRHLNALLLFDNCEHVVQAVAPLCEKLLREVPDARILVTTREPLLADGERARRLAPLALPPETISSAAEALQSPAVQLFMDRAAGRSPEFSELSEIHAQTVANICRKLDGLALALELAAGQVDNIGLRELDSLLDERFLQLGGGIRTADDRHKTLAATLDWSYGLLPTYEQTLLQRLGVFTGSFDLAAGTLVAGDAGPGNGEVLAGILSLAAKSLIVVEKSADAVKTRYRLLETTRTYAVRQLRLGEGEAETRVRHAKYCISLCLEAEAEWDRLDRSQWLALYSYSIGDIRSAIDWCMGNGETTLGLELILASAPLGVQLSLVDEYRLRVEAGLQRILAERLAPLLELQFTTALGHLQQQLRGPVPSVLQAFDHCLTLANELGHPRLKADAYRGLWVAAISSGNYPLALEHATRQVDFAEAAEDRFSLLQAKRMQAQALHYNGDFDQAAALAHEVIEDPLRHIPLRENFPLQVNRRVSLGIILARMAWIRGQRESANEIVAECLELAAADHAIALCHALALAACPIAFWSGEYERVNELSQQLIEHADRSASTHWQSWGQLYRDALSVKLDGSTQPALWAALTQYPKLDMLATLDTAFATGVTQERVEARLVGWCAAEVLRARAERSLLAGARGDAALMLQQATEIAQAQRADGWLERIERTTKLL
jgi:predicted ATPase/DNA-binding winged helix-turn-helix (wHTH) protein